MERLTPDGLIAPDAVVAVPHTSLNLRFALELVRECDSVCVCVRARVRVAACVIAPGKDCVLPVATGALLHLAPLHARARTHTASF